MHRFYIQGLAGGPKALTLPEAEATHAARVLRVQPGQEITLLDGRGHIAAARVRSVNRKQVEVEILSLHRAPSPKFTITLFQSVTRPKSMDWIVEKATELGIDKIQPILTERIVSRMDQTEAARKVEKWQRTAIEAIKQCGGPWLPQITSPLTLPESIHAAARFPGKLVASLANQTTELRPALRQALSRSDFSDPIQVGLWIGPEGDFTPDEISQLLSTEAMPITLGENVLRSETAAVCALSLLRYELRLIQKTASERG